MISRHKLRYENNKESEKARSLEYYRQHREERLEYNKAHTERHREWHKSWRSANRDRNRTQRRKWFASQRAFLARLKDKPCVDCGGKFPPEAMDFDHLPGTRKLCGISELRFSRAKMLEEIAKCEVVCANCHRVRTARRRREPLAKGLLA